MHWLFELLGYALVYGLGFAAGAEFYRYRIEVAADNPIFMRIRGRKLKVLPLDLYERMRDKARRA